MKRWILVTTSMISRTTSNNPTALQDGGDVDDRNRKKIPREENLAPPRLRFPLRQPAVIFLLCAQTGEGPGRERYEPEDLLMHRRWCVRMTGCKEKKIPAQRRTADQAECLCAYCCASNQLWRQPTLSNPNTPTPSMGLPHLTLEASNQERKNSPQKPSTQCQTTILDFVSEKRSTIARQIIWVTSRLHCAAG